MHPTRNPPGPRVVKTYEWSELGLGCRVQGVGALPTRQPQVTSEIGIKLILAWGTRKKSRIFPGIPGEIGTGACYRGYSKLRTHAAIGPYGRSTPRSIGPS